MRSIYSLGISLLIVVGCWSSASATIPSALVGGTLYNLGYLDCEEYAGVTNNETGDSLNGLNTCIRDAYTGQFTAYLKTCNAVYLISNTLKAYEWVAWNPNINAPSGAPQTNNVIRGAKCTPTTRPEIKIKTGSTAFQSASNPRPMVAYRTFVAINANANVTNPPDPSHPLASWESNNLPGDPANFREAGNIGFTELFEGIDLHTNNHAGAIGITMQAAQGANLFNTKITATGSIAGIYNPPGRNSVTANVEVIGGDYCVLAGNFSSPSLVLDPPQGFVLVGMTCTNQAKRAFLFNDGVPPVVVGFQITKSSDGPAIENLLSGVVLKDGRITMSAPDAAGDVAIANVDAAGQARNAYLTNVFVSGTTQLVKSGAVVSGPTTGSGTWSQIVEYIANDFYQKDANTTATVFPTYQEDQESRFEARSFINGTLSGAAILPAQIVRSPSLTPPTDLLTRHVWTELPDFTDGAYVDPTTLGDCDAYRNYDLRQVVNKTSDCTAEINTAITNAASAGHNRVVIPNGTMIITGTINMAANTKLLGAGPHKSGIAYKDTWSPTSAVPLIQTTNIAGDAPYVGFLSLFIKTQPNENDWMYFLRWRAGKTSMTIGLDFDSQFKCVCNQTLVNGVPKCNIGDQPRNAWWFSGNGGGRHYGNGFPLIKNFDRNANSHTVYIQGTSQPLSIYGFNLEGAKTAGSCGLPTTNAEVINSANVRTYGSKQESQASTMVVTDSTNVASYGLGALSGPPQPAAQAVLRVDGASNHVLFAPAVVRNNLDPTNGVVMVRETIDGLPTASMIPWPNALSVYKRGTLDESMFTVSGTPAPAAPSFLSAEIIVANRLDACWQIFDSTAMVPSSATTGWTVLVNGVSQPVTSSTLQGVNCYQLNFAGGTITSGTQSVVLSYSPGNITAGGPGTPAATGFSGFTVANNLTPTASPFYTQVAYGIRSIHGLTDATSSPWYTSAAGVFESVPFRGLAGGAVRIVIQVAVTTGTAPSQAFQVYYNENEGTYVPLTNSCATERLCFADIPALSDGNTLATPQLTSVQSTFVPCGVMESTAGQVFVELSAGSETECEIGVQSKSDAALFNRYRLQLRRAGGATFDSYPEAGVPLLTIVSPRASMAGGTTQ